MAHIILVTKYRKKLLSGNFRKSVKQALYEVCLEHHWYIIRMETDNDHVHILLQYNPADSITGIVSLLKQVSTWRLWKDCPVFLSHHYWKERTLWSDGYFAASIGQVSQRTIEHYIENQGK